MRDGLRDGLEVGFFDGLPEVVGKEVVLAMVVGWRVVFLLTLVEAGLMVERLVGGRTVVPGDFVGRVVTELEVATGLFFTEHCAASGQSQFLL